MGVFDVKRERGGGGIGSGGIGSGCRLLSVWKWVMSRLKRNRVKVGGGGGGGGVYTGKHGASSASVAGMTSDREIVIVMPWSYSEDEIKSIILKKRSRVGLGGLTWREEVLLARKMAQRGLSAKEELVNVFRRGGKKHSSTMTVGEGEKLKELERHGRRQHRNMLKEHWGEDFVRHAVRHLMPDEETLNESCRRYAGRMVPSCGRHAGRMTPRSALNETSHVKKYDDDVPLRVKHAVQETNEVINMWKNNTITVLPPPPHSVQGKLDLPRDSPTVGSFCIPAHRLTPAP